MADHSWRGHGRFSAPNSLRGQMSSPNRPPPLMQKHVLPPDVRNRGNQFAAPMPGVFEPRPLRYPLGRSFARGPSPRGPGRNTPSFPRPRMPVRIPIDYKFAGMEVQSRFPNPKEKLHNILQCATKQPRGVHYTHANVDGQYWSATVHMEWPRASSFTGEGFEKKDAERRAAALACAHLLQSGVNVSGSSVSFKREALATEGEPQPLYIGDDVVTRIETLLQKASQTTLILNSNEKKVEQSAVNTSSSEIIKDVFTGSPWQPNLEQSGASSLDTSNRKISMDTLPVANFRHKILELTAQHQVVVISGETGCGKTTQIPQFILDEAIQKGQRSSCNVVVTQPRRIVAMSIAERVAHERGEVLGKSVGYQVRLEGVPPTIPGRILFCTTGILLRRIQSNADLQGVSHVIVDEVHERDINTDFLLILLRELLSQQPLLKVVIMSATVDAARFCQYFNSCPLLNIPGFTHPVTEYYLDDIKQRLQLGNAPPQRWLPGNELGKRFKPDQSALNRDEESPEADPVLVVDVIAHLSRNLKEEGAILCFLAGWDEIMVVHDMLTSRLDPSKHVVLPLHSMLPMGNQHFVFDRPPPGVRKVVLSTNIAETSVTIDDVVFVVNAGNMKEKTYDAQKKVTCLTTHWTSRASVIQRRGRAGRVRSGWCYNLFSRQRYEQMEAYQKPEMLRMSLEEIVLQAKIQRPRCSAAQFLSNALDSPDADAVKNAVDVLQELGALDNQESLTSLGRHMANLPVDPRIGKMIIYGAIFRCLDPVLTVAASLGYKDPFVSPLGKRAQADKVRRSFADTECSDHVAMLNAFRGWKNSQAGGHEMEFLFQNFLHRGTLNIIEGMREQFYRVLLGARLVPADESGQPTNAFSSNLELVKAILCAGVFPNVIKIGLGLESKGKCGKTRLRQAFRTKNDGRVVMHPSSVNSDVKSCSSRWLVFHEKVKSSHLYIRDSSRIHPIALLCFGGKGLSVVGSPRGATHAADSAQVVLAVDGDPWMGFRCTPRVASMLQHLRAGLDTMVTQCVSSNRSGAVAGLHAELVEAVCGLLTTEQPPYPGNATW